jgi:hypothetical protein
VNCVRPRCFGRRCRRRKERFIAQTSRSHSARVPRCPSA